jgi:hypothetical protein
MRRSSGAATASGPSVPACRPKSVGKARGGSFGIRRRLFLIHSAFILGPTGEIYSKVKKIELYLQCQWNVGDSIMKCPTTQEVLVCLYVYRVMLFMCMYTHMIAFVYAYAYVIM